MSTIVLALVIASIVIILWEEYITDLTDQPRPSTPAAQLHSNKTDESFKCWLSESYDVIDQCAKCPRSQITSEDCKATGFKEKVECKQYGYTEKPCNLPSDHFWSFELSMIVVALAGSYFCNYRENTIERMIMDKINKQIASGV